MTTSTMIVFRILILLSSWILISSAGPTNSEKPAETKPTDHQASMYGRKTNLQALFGDPVASDGFVPAINDPIVDLDQSRANLKVQSYGIDYIDLNYNDRDRNRWTEIPGDDTPTAIAKDLLARNRKFIVILGAPGSGKTVALTKILSVLRADAEITWSLLVNLKKAVPQPLLRDWQPSQIFSETLGPKQTQLFHELLKRNPQKINVLLDNFNLIPDFDTRKKIYQYAETIYEKGAGLVLTTTLSTGQSIPIPNSDEIRTSPSDRAYVETPLLKTDKVLELFVTKDLELHFSSSKNIHEYAKAIAKGIQEMPMPKTFENIELVCLSVISGDRNIFVDEEFVGLREYLKSDKASPEEYQKMLQSTDYNRMRLFEKLTARSVPSSKAATYYGLEALQRIYSGYPLDVDYKWKLSPVTSKADYNGNGEEFGLLQHERFKSIFVHSEYDIYFAAKALFNEVAANSYYHRIMMFNILKNQLQGPEVTEFMKFLDAAVAVDRSNGIRFAVQMVWANFEHFKALDYAFVSKLDSLAAAIIEPGFSIFLSEYLKQDAGSSFKQVNPHDQPELAKTALYDRQEMLFRNAMIKSANAIKNLIPDSNTDVEVWRPEEFGRYADEMVVYETKQSLRTMKMILECAPNNLLTEIFFNDRLFSVISKGGLKSRPIIEKWIELGAVPSNINVEGKTLVHIAVQNRDLPLLKYLVEDLNMQIVDNTANVRSLLITALDSNPMPRYSMPHFWQVMEYLLHATGGLRVLKARSSALKIGHIIPTAADKVSPAFKLITGTEDEAALSRARSELARSPALVDELSLPVKQFRRNKVLSRGIKLLSNYKIPDLTTQTEVLLKYRGLDALSPEEQAAYERCIRLAVKQDVTKANGKLSDRQLDRIRKSLVDNIGTEADYQFAKSFVKTDLVAAHGKPEKTVKFAAAVEEKFLERMSQPLKTLKISLASGVKETRAHYYSQIPSNSDAVTSENFKNIFACDNLL